MLKRRAAVALAAAGVAVVAACSGSRDDAPTAAVPGATGRPPVYVAVGASETVGVGADDPATEAWPAVFDRTALPADAVFVNVGISGAKVADALLSELPLALDRSPDLVTVWLNVNDIIGQVPPAEFERQLGELVHGLRRNGATKVLVANAPEIDQLPVIARFGPLIAAAADRAVDDYNAATRRVVDREGAVLVDIHAATEAAEADGSFASLVSGDGFHPSTAGHAAVAKVFVAALASSGGIG